MFTVSSTLMWAVLTGPADWVCHIGTLMPCIEVVAQSCIIVTWWSGPGGIQALSERPTGFLQCFDTDGLVIWPVKHVPDMTYNVFGGTLNIAQSLVHHPLGTSSARLATGCVIHGLGSLPTTSPLVMMKPVASMAQSTIVTRALFPFLLRCSCKVYREWQTVCNNPTVMISTKLPG